MEKSEDCSIIQSIFKELILAFMSEIGKEMLVGTTNHCLMRWGGGGFVIHLVVAVSVTGVEGVQKSQLVGRFRDGKGFRMPIYLWIDGS